MHVNLQHLLVTNPDDHDCNYKICLRDSISGEVIDCCLLILSKYQTWIGYTDFSARINVLLEYLDSKLHPIRFVDGAWKSALYEDGNPIAMDITHVPEFYNKIGIRLNETISPEEIAAKSFVLLAKAGKNKKPNKAETERLKQLKDILCEND